MYYRVIKFVSINVKTIAKFGLIFLIVFIVVEWAIKYVPVFDWLKLIDQSVYFSLLGGAASIVAASIKQLRDRFNKKIEVLTTGQNSNNELIKANYLEIVESIRAVDNRVSSIKTSMNAFESLIEKDEQHDLAFQEIKKEFAALVTEYARLKERQDQDDRIMIFMQEINNRLMLFMTELAQCQKEQNYLNNKIDLLSISMTQKKDS